MAPRLPRILVATMLMMGGVAFSASPATAAAEGHLLMKGSGSYYTPVQAVVQTIPAGTTGKAFYFKAVNDGSAPQSFRVQLQPHPDLTGTLYQGYRAVQGDHFTTPEVAPGGSYSFKVRIFAPSTGLSTDTGYQTFVFIRDPETLAQTDLAIPTVRNPANLDAPSPGTNMYIKTNRQTVQARTTSGLSTNAVRPRGSVTGYVTFLNNSTSPISVPLLMNVSGGCPTLAVKLKQGYHDITAAVSAGTYTTGVLAPGKSVTISVRITAGSAPCGLSSYAPQVSFKTTTSSFSIPSGFLLVPSAA